MSEPVDGACRVRVIDSHTEGEPTRVIFEGTPDLGGGPATARVARLVKDHESWRAAMVRGPRGSTGVVAALLLPPEDPRALTQVLYFNAEGPLPMCVHATLGLVETLRRYADLPSGAHRIETAAGSVQIEALGDGRSRVENVVSRRTQRAVRVETDAGPITGDVAWGGNWFFVADDPDDAINVDQVPRLVELCHEIDERLFESNVRGTEGQRIDHVYLMGAAARPDAEWRSFVLCPDGNYDRSPCGTGTSAVMALLAEDGRVEAERDYIVQSVTGSTFTARVERVEANEPDGGYRPTITGRAFITGETTLVFHDGDPWGLSR